MLGSGYVAPWAETLPSGGTDAPPTFVLPLADLGAGVVDTTPATGVGPATFTRATAAASKLSTGLWKLDVASGTARSSYLGLDTTVGAYGGYLAEGARTNSCLQSRDLTNASWTKTTLTTAKTSTGIDGTATSCTRCTASAGNGQATQAIVLASAAKAFSVWIKRVTGTGIVQISLDNFATNTDVTALINSSTFTLVQMTQTLANPTVGIRLVTSADAIDVDVCQLEDSATFSSTPIPTTTIAVTRNADVLTYPSAGNLSNTAGSTYAEIVSSATTPTIHALATFNVSGGTAMSINTADNKLSIYDDTAFRAVSAAISRPITTITKMATSWGATASGAVSSVVLSGVAYDGNMNFNTNLGIGIAPDASAAIFGTIKNVRLWLRQVPDGMLASLTT